MTSHALLVYERDQFIKELKVKFYYLFHSPTPTDRQRDD
jgi:hypothetical protein